MSTCGQFAMMSRKRQSFYGDPDRPDYRYQRCATSPYADSHTSSQALSRRSSIFSDLYTVFRKNTISQLHQTPPKKSSNALEQGLLIRQDSVVPTPSKRFSAYFLKIEMNLNNPKFSETIRAMPKKTTRRSRVESLVDINYCLRQVLKSC